jgi:hypothetical protein
VSHTTPFSKRIEIISAFEARHADPEAGALLLWTTFCIESLAYLDDIDKVFGESAVGGLHDPAVVDISHARWAPGTCVTALDLSSAALGRVFCSYKPGKELRSRTSTFSHRGRQKRRPSCWQRSHILRACGWKISSLTRVTARSEKYAIG